MMEAGSGWKRDERWNVRVKMEGEWRHWTGREKEVFYQVAMETLPKRLRALGCDRTGGDRRRGSVALSANQGCSEKKLKNFVCTNRQFKKKMD